MINFFGEYLSASSLFSSISLAPPANVFSSDISVFAIIAFALFGLIIGSFLNVLILRFNTGKGFGGRSMCFSCSRQLTTIDLIPVFSFLGFKGRCRSCKSKISPQYILVEIATALSFVAVYLHNTDLFNMVSIESISVQLVLKVLIDLVIMSLLVAMVAYDMRHKIIPDIAVIFFGIFALLSQVVIGAMSWSILFAGPIVALPFYLIWRLSDGRWMGLGDAKLVIGFGWMLGLTSAITAIIFGFWLGAIISVGIIALQRLSKIDSLRRLTRKLRIPHLTLKSEVPFAPFLISGLLIVYILGYNLFTFSL